MKSKNKRRKKAKRARNREYTIISYFFVVIFLSLIGYMVYFNVEKREAVISSPYNTRQNQMERADFKRKYSFRRRTEYY